MDKLVVIAAFTYPHELAVARGLLESEGIECFTRDELTVQVYNLYSNALGGIKLLVNESNAERAIAILKEAGYGAGTGEKLTAPELFIHTAANSIDGFSSKIPVFGKWPLIVRVLALFGLALFIPFSIIAYINAPTLAERLRANGWCVDRIIYKNTEQEINTLGFVITTKGICKDRIEVFSGGRIYFPGLNTKMVSGSWKVLNHSLVVIASDTLGQVYDGTFKVDFSGQKLKLSSESTVIYCHRSMY